MAKIPFPNRGKGAVGRIEAEGTLGPPAGNFRGDASLVDRDAEVMAFVDLVARAAQISRGG